MKVGKNVKIHPTVQIFGDEIEIGENVRIDAFCILTGKIRIGSHIHIAAGSMFYGGAGIELCDFSQFAPRTLVMSTCDDWSGLSLVGPQVPDELKPGLQKEPVLIGRHVLIGANTTVLPGVMIGEGCSIGAHSLVKDNLDPWGVYAGVPVKWITDRSRRMLDFERQFLEAYGS